MNEFVMGHETAIRLGVFLGVFILVAVAEMLAPRRVLSMPKGMRWFSNLGIVFISTLAVRALFPLAAVGMALLVEERGWGLLNNFAIPYWLAVVIAVVVLDFIIYLQHVMFHAVPLLWRLHMMHHADLDFDVTTGARFHPIEIVISMLIKLAVISVLGPPVLAVLIFEVLLNATAMFNHSNWRIPLAVDRVLRFFVVTPDMHRVHHSVIARETNSNFGFNLPWWDRLFGTYRAQPQQGHEDMTIGLTQFRDPKRLTLPWMLALPFVGKTGEYPINRWGGAE